MDAADTNAIRRLLLLLCAALGLAAWAGCEDRQGTGPAAARPAPPPPERPAAVQEAEAAEPEGAQAEAPPAGGAADERDPRWAAPLDEPGLPNLHKVSDGLYRSAQPTAGGMERAKEMGIRTIVNLRSFHSDRDEIGETALAYEHIRMKAWHPEDEDVVRFLQVITDPARQPVLVHCQHGADRTGMMCAVYRVAVEGWTVEDAADEMTDGGYGFHDIWKGTLLKHLRELHFEDIRSRAGLAGDGPAADSEEETDAE